MRFSLVHKTCCYLVIITSTLALFASGELNPFVLGLTAVAMTLSWFWEPPRVQPERFVITWNVLTVMALAKTIFDIFTGGSVLISAIYFIVFLSVNKLFNRQASGDYLQLYVVSLLEMIAATALSSDMTYGLLFLFYIVFSTWTLMLFHLKREMEDNFLLKYGESLEGKPVQVQRVLDSRRIVGWRFLGITSLASVVVFAGAASFFFLFPRIGFRLFSQARPGLAMSGFSTQVELGHFGRIKENSTVVMRVEFDNPQDRTALRPYWRGVSFDHYDGRRWTKSLSRTKRVLPRRGHRVGLGESLDDRPLVKQQIYLEPMESRVLFALDKVRQLEFPRMGDLDVPGRYRAVQRDIDGDLYYEQLDEIAFRYTAFSSATAPTASPGQISLPAYRDLIERFEHATNGRFRQAPSSQQSRVQALAQEILGDAATLDEALSNFRTHLAENYAYTLNLGRDESMAPLEDFLFIQKKGHCEYFATSLVMLLRSVGIGARLVNGFHGGRWNAFGNYMAVTQGEAHSWVEVLVPERNCSNGVCHWQERWILQDPTPSGRPGQANASIWMKFQEYTDAFRMRWYKYVIEYDLERQVSFVVALRDGWRKLRGDSPSKKTTNDRASSTTAARWVGGALASVLLVGVLVAVWRRRSSDGSRTEHIRRLEALVSLVEFLLSRYSAIGLERLPSETTTEFLERLRVESAPGLELAAEVLELYEQVRFAGVTTDDAAISALRKQVKALVL